MNGTNAGSLAVLANMFSVSNNAPIAGTLSVTGKSMFYGTLTTVNGGSAKFTVDASGNVSPPGLIPLTTPLALFVNGVTALTCSFAVPTPVTGTTYQEYLKPVVRCMEES